MTCELGDSIYILALYPVNIRCGSVKKQAKQSQSPSPIFTNITPQCSGRQTEAREAHAACQPRFAALVD